MTWCANETHAQHKYLFIPQIGVTKNLSFRRRDGGRREGASALKGHRPTPPAHDDEPVAFSVSLALRSPRRSQLVLRKFAVREMGQGLLA